MPSETSATVLSAWIGSSSSDDAADATSHLSRSAIAFLLSRSAVSHHLKLLKEAGVLGSEKVGKEVYYWIDKQFLDQSLSAVLVYIRTHT